MSEFVDVVTAPAPEAPPSSSGAPVAAPTAPAIREAFVEGSGWRPAAGRDVARDGAGFTTRPGGAREVIVEGGSAGRLLPKAMLEKLQVGWGERPAADPAPATTAPAAADPAKPVEPVPATETPAAAAPAVPAAEVKQPDATPTPPPEVAEITAARDRLLAQNAALVAEIEAARAKPAEPTVAKSKLDEAWDGYIEDPEVAIRRGIAHALGLDDPQHADVTAELDALIPDLTAKRFDVPLDETKQASRDTAKVRQALARDKRSRKAESDTAAKTAQAQAEAAKVQGYVSFIGNRLSLPRADGKSYRDQFPVATSLAPMFSGKPIEDVVLESIPHLTRLGILDQKRTSDDDYIVHETIKYLDTQYTNRYQALSDEFGKARPKPSTPATPPSTAAPSPPATAPAATTSASTAPPQGHGGRTLTTADSSVAPATPPSTPAPARTSSGPKRMESREEFLSKRYPSPNR